MQHPERTRTRRPAHRPQFLTLPSRPSPSLLTCHRVIRSCGACGVAVQLLLSHLRSPISCLPTPPALLLVPNCQRSPLPAPPPIFPPCHSSLCCSYDRSHQLLNYELRYWVLQIAFPFASGVLRAWSFSTPWASQPN